MSGAGREAAGSGSGELHGDDEVLTVSCVRRRTSGEGVAEIGEDLPGRIEVLEGRQGEGLDQGLAGALGPFTANQVGNLE